MADWKKYITYLFVLFISVAGMYAILVMISMTGITDPNIRDSVLAVGGGLLGGLSYAHFAVANPDVIPKTE